MRARETIEDEVERSKKGKFFRAKVINQLTFESVRQISVAVMWVDWSCHVKVILLSIHVVCGQRVIY